MVEWFLYQIPWWVYALLAVIIALAVWRLVGTKAALAVAAALGAAVLHRKGQQTGWRDRETKIQRDRQRARDTSARVEQDIARGDPKDNREELKKWGK